MDYTSGLDDAWAAASMQATNILAWLNQDGSFHLAFNQNFNSFGWINEKPLLQGFILPTTNEDLGFI